MNLTDALNLCDDRNILSNKDMLVKVGKLLGVESKTFNEIPNKGWNSADREMKVRKLIRGKEIFKLISRKKCLTRLSR